MTSPKTELMRGRAERHIQLFLAQIREFFPITGLPLCIIRWVTLRQKVHSLNLSWKAKSSVYRRPPSKQRNCCTAQSCRVCNVHNSVSQEFDTKSWNHLLSVNWATDKKGQEYWWLIKAIFKVSVLSMGPSRRDSSVSSISHLYTLAGTCHMEMFSSPAH